MGLFFAPRKSVVNLVISTGAGLRAESDLGEPVRKGAS